LRVREALKSPPLIHMALGLGLTALVIFIPIWRLFAPSPDYSSSRPHWLQISLTISESLLFILRLVSALTGCLA
jgi:cytochrome b561